MIGSVSIRSLRQLDNPILGTFDKLHCNSLTEMFHSKEKALFIFGSREEMFLGL
jgi:hypothetical protein